jgi:transposase
VPQLPPRCKITRRLLGQAGPEVAGRGITPAEAARHAGISWPSAHEAFAAAADRVLEEPPAPVAHLGIDEHRRGRPRWRTDEVTGEYVQLADRWHTCFYDLSGQQGLLGQMKGRTAGDTAYWRAPRPRGGMPRAGRRHRHVHHLPVRGPADAARCAGRGGPLPRRAAGRQDARRRAPPRDPGEIRPPRQVRRPRVRLQAPAGAQPGKPRPRPVRQDHQHPGRQPARAADRPRLDRQGKLRDALRLRARVTGSTPCERQVRDKLFAFYDWCARHDDIPELLTLAKTISRWENEIVTAVTTSVTNATAESLNRLAKLEARPAYGFRNPASQRRRVRIACTCGTRRKTATGTHRNTTRNVTRQKHNPG